MKSIIKNKQSAISEKSQSNGWYPCVKAATIKFIPSITDLNMKISIPTDCDNAPKRRLIRDFILGFYQGNWKVIEGLFEEKFEWTIVGKSQLTDLHALKKHGADGKAITELTVHEILSHGKFGACHGHIHMEQQLMHFAFFFEFKSAGKSTISKITEYSIPSS